MIRRCALVLLVWCAPAATVAGQQPTVSPSLERVFDRDTTIGVWLFASPQYRLRDIRTLVQSLGGQIRRESRWLHAVSADLAARAIRAAAGRPEFTRIQPVRRFVSPPVFPPRYLHPASRPAVPHQDSTFGPSAMPIRVLNLAPLVDRGFRGRGIKIAVLDTGFETELAAFSGTAVVAQRDFVSGDSIVRDQPGIDTLPSSGHGTATWSLLAANVTGSLIGIAPDADYILAKTEEVGRERRLEEDNYVAALEWADSLGAHVVSSSLGYLTFDGGSGYTPADLDGDVAVTTVAADMAAARGIAVVTAAGNEGLAGPGSLTSPADGDSVIAVGATDSAGVLAAFSSRGPTADGRIKPDLTAPGVNVFALSPGGFVRVNGTSFSTPLIAGSVALLRESQPTLGPIDLRNALTQWGSNAGAPNSDLGWGTPDVALAAIFPRGVAVTQPIDSVLASVTPTIQWSAADVPAFAMPVTYRLRVGTDTSLAALLVDTSLTMNRVALAQPLVPGATLAFQLTATAADSTAVTLPVSRQFRAPPWARLAQLDDPAGNTIRDLRPVFSWTSPDVDAPPGPFTYGIEVFRDDNGAVDAAGNGLTQAHFTPSEDLDHNTPYRWRVTARLEGDSAVTESRGTFVIIDDSAPPVTLLFQNFPNPFPDRLTGRTATCIWFDLSASGRVELHILDLRGHLVRDLTPGGRGSILPPGRYGRPATGAPGRCDSSLEWDGTSDAGRPVPQGVYIVKLRAPAGTFFKRIVYLGSDR